MGDEKRPGYKMSKLGWIPEDWDIKILGKILKRVRKSVEVESESKYQEIGIRSHCKGIFYKKEIKGRKIGNKRVFWIEPDCFVFNNVFAWEQAIALTASNERGMIASHRFPMYKSIKNYVDLNFLLYFFSTPRGKYLLGLASPGGAGRNKTLGLDKFLKIKIPYPPITEQRKIAEILSTWDEAIEKTEALIQAKMKLKKGLMQQLLTGKRGFGGVNINIWKKLKIKDIGEVITGTTPPTNRHDNYGNDFNFVTPGDLGKRKYVSITEKKLSLRGLKKAKLIPKGTIFFTCIGSTIGKMGIATQQMATNQQINSIFCKSDYCSEFVYYLLKYKSKRIRLLAGTQAVPIINKSSFEIIQILMPIDKEEQRKIASVLSTIDEEISTLQNQLSTLKQQKKGLMQQLLTGKRRVTP